MKKILYSIVMLILLIVLTSCVQQVQQVEKPELKYCSVDADCVAETCCHPRDAVNSYYAPRCEGIVCTQECVPRTMDCGQGRIKCVNSECQVILRE